MIFFFVFLLLSRKTCNTNFKVPFNKNFLFWHYCLFVPEQKSSRPNCLVETILCFPEYRNPWTVWLNINMDQSCKLTDICLLNLVYKLTEKSWMSCITVINTGCVSLFVSKIVTRHTIYLNVCVRYVTICVRYNVNSLIG